jgi:hypothetical protein
LQVYRPHHERNPGGLAILRLASRQTSPGLVAYADLQSL